MSRYKDFNIRQIPHRDYQIELLERAKADNTIVSLGTGAGKTFIAILLIKEYTHRLVQNGEKAIFVVNSIPLVEQQATQIEFHSTLNVARIDGSIKKGKSDSIKVNKFFRNNQVIVLTAQIFIDFLSHALFNLSEVALLIIDECHHCLGDQHPYRLIMNFYKRHQGEKPRVLGLTASVLNRNIPLRRIELTVRKLESIMCANFDTASDLTTICKYMTKPRQFVVITKDDCTNENYVMDLLRRLHDFVDKNNDFQSDIGIDPRRPIIEAIVRASSTLQQVGSWCAFKGCHIWQKKLLELSQDQILKPRQRSLLRTAETKLRICSKILNHKIKAINSYAELTNPKKKFISDRAYKMLEILRNYSPSKREKSGVKDTFSGLIFVKERFIAYMINNLIKFLVKIEPDNFGYLKSDFLVSGRNNNTEAREEDKKLANRKQEQTLQKFRNGQLNLLIATSVLEEGIDIRNCNLVVRFDAPKDFRTYIQSRGRARKENSAFHILLEEKNYSNFMAELLTYSQIEEFLLKRYRSKNEFLTDAMVHDIDDIIPPYVVNSSHGKAQVTLSGAIQLVNRYCAKLPSDIFTRLVPQYTIHTYRDNNDHTLYQAQLMLPINSPLKEVVTTGKFQSKSLAIMATALEACKRLHQRKELNDQLLPTGKEITTDLLGEIDDEEYLPYSFDKVGSSKKKRLYDRKMSKYLAGILPEIGTECFVYVLEMKLVNPISEENNPKRRRIIDPYETKLAFGFFSSKELPMVPIFPVYQRQGEMSVHIRKIQNQLRLTPELFHLICLFHKHLFEDILRVVRGGVAFSPEHSPIPLLIIPLKRGFTDLDYELDESYLSWDIRNPLTIPSDEYRRRYNFDENDYINSVVMPWYRSEDQSAFYYVAEILRDQTPSSGFPDAKFTSFNEYFKVKYKLEIFNQNQFLLDVDHTSARMNLLLPRANTGRIKRPLDPSQRQILVPELVHIHPLTASLWTMIIALPTVLYRYNSLLLADEFRVKVMESALGLDSNSSPIFTWENLSYVTQNSDQTEQQIKTLDQLKQINQMERISEKQIGQREDHFGTEAMDVNHGDEGEKQFDFEIGVWDPSDGTEYIANQEQQQPVNNNEHRPKNGIRLNQAKDEEISELIAIGNDSSIHNYGEMSDDEDMEFGNFRVLMDNKMTSTDIGDVECMEVREIGWNADDIDLGSNSIQMNSENLPLTILSNNPQINITGLINDLDKTFATNNMPTVNIPLENQQSGQIAMSKKEFNLDPLQVLDEMDRRDTDNKTDVILSEDFYQNGEFEQESLEQLEEDTQFSLPTKQSDSPFSLDEKQTTQKFEVFAPANTTTSFSFSFNKFKENFVGVSPALLLQALTTTSAADGINLERLETIGDSFLKMAVTNYLYHKHQEQHEGKLSFARSKEVSNSHLFILGRQKGIPLLMETSKFDPHVNWLPPCYASTSEFHAINPLDYADLEENTENQLIEKSDRSNASITNQKADTNGEETGWGTLDDDNKHYKCENGVESISFPQQMKQDELPPMPCNMLTQQWISDKSIADAVEALIGAHLIELGQEATLKFMSWIGIKVLTEEPKLTSPLLRFIDTFDDPNRSLKSLMLLYDKFDFAEVEKTIGYRFANKAYLIQAFTHASYFNNRVTGCYQRLEFLGDAVLDYMITRYLFEHKKQYSPGVLTDLRSALVNNTIFASLAVKYNFHKHFVMLCPPLHNMVEKFVNFCRQKDFSHCANFDDEIFMITEDEIDEGHEEDVEVPKAMGDIFESVAGAVYLDCCMDLDIVWRVFYALMREVVDKCCANPPQSPVRELFERKNCKAKFAKLERKLETGKVRVTVTVNDNLQFTGMGRSYRIAKCTAAKRALQHLRKLDEARNSSKGKEAVKV